MHLKHIIAGPTIEFKLWVDYVTKIDLINCKLVKKKISN